MMSPFLFVKSACVLWISLDDMSYVIWSPMRQQGSMRVLGACRTCITSCRANACPASTFLDQRIYDGFVFGVGKEEEFGTIRQSVSPITMYCNSYLWLS